MNKQLLNLIIWAVKRLTSKRVMNFITQQVIIYVTSDLPGEQKRQAVIESVKANYPQIKSWLLNLALEAIVAKQKQQQ